MLKIEVPPKFPEIIFAQFNNIGINRPQKNLKSYDGRPLNGVTEDKTTASSKRRQEGANFDLENKILFFWHV